MSERERGPRGGAPGDPGESGLGTILRRGVKSALARWAVRHRPQEASWPRPQDEATHPWDGRPHYAEEYSFVAVQADLAVILRIEWLPGRGAHRIWATILGDGEVYALPGAGQQVIPGDADASHWRCGGLVIDCSAPLQSWSLRFRGPLEARGADGEPGAAAGERPPTVEGRIDLVFTATAPPFVPGSDDDPELISQRLGDAEWDAELLRGIRRRPIRSYVQVGVIHGSVAIGARILAVSAAALREHAWGVRDWGASDHALRCFLAEGRSARLWAHRAVFPWLTLEGGFVCEGGALRPLRALGVTSERRPGRAPRRVGLDVVAEGREEAIEVETVAAIGLDMDGRGWVDLAFVRGGKAVGVWLGQRRLLPRPGRP